MGEVRRYELMQALAWAGQTILSATELADPDVRRLIDGGYVETWRTGPIAGDRPSGHTFLAARLTEKALDKHPELRRPARWPG